MGVDDGIDVRVVAKHRPRYWYHRRVRPRGARRATGLGNDLTRFYRIELEVRPVWKSKFYGAFVLNQRVVLLLDGVAMPVPRRSTECTRRDG